MQASTYSTGEWNSGKDIDLSFLPRKTTKSTKWRDLGKWKSDLKEEENSVSFEN